jgi:Xaa-Pro aminopeptidase
MKLAVQKIQNALKDEEIDGWLFYNFRESNIFASRILKLPSHLAQSRRYFYFIPVSGEPIKIVHNIEQWNLDHLPGEKLIYLTYQSLQGALAKALSNLKVIAMEYSPKNSIPYISKVDGGTIESIRELGKEIVTSANLIQFFEARWDEEQATDNVETAKDLRAIVDLTFSFIRNQILSNLTLTEYDVQQFMKSEFTKRGMKTDSDPNCSVNENSANPHYEPTKEINSPMKKGDFVLLDLWAKRDKPRSVYSDITWVGYIGDSVPDEYRRIFRIVATSRDTAVIAVRNAFSKNEPIYGFQVDDAARKVIVDAGYGEYFVHRTGHSIGEEVHGNGANMDNLETHDERRIIPQTSFSIEPGIYLPGKFGIRSEINVYITPNENVVVTGLPIQQEVVPILK